MTTINKIGVLFLIFGFCFSVACTKTQEGLQLQTTDTVLQNMDYGSNAAQKMDISLPANRTSKTKLIILVHGGGWNAGDKAELAFFAAGFKMRGFAVANINYRLSPQSADNYKMQLDDLGSALAFLKSRANQYVFSKSEIYITGHSAGAHLSLAFAYTRNGDKSIKAAAGMATPTDLVAGATANFGIVGATTIAPYLGSPLNAGSRARYELASPFYQVNNNTPPTILFQGNVDIIVPLEQSIALKAKLQTFGIPINLIIYPGGGHDWWGDAARVANTMDETAAWFNQY